MIQRCPFSIAQPIIVLGFVTASIFLIIMVGIAGQTSWKGTPEEDFILTEAFYYACWAAGLYAIVGSLMAVTVWGAFAGHIPKEFQLTTKQRTLMVQTTIFMAYLLIGALIYSYVEGWAFLNAVYWADFTLLTVGIGDFYAPKTKLGRGLIIPFSIGGIVALGLVVSAINGLVLDASSDKLGARSIERKREAVLRSMNYEKGRYNISWYKRRYFDTDKDLSELQRRKQEFLVMHDIIRYAKSNRAWRSLGLSFLCFAILWFCGAAVFMATETAQKWSYFDGLYFSWIVLLTIGYGDLEAQSNSGRPFFVLWSLLAVPALTVLIGDLSDTIVLGVSELTDYVFRLVQRPNSTVRSTAKKLFTPQYLPSNFDAEFEAGISDVILKRLQSEDIRSAERAGIVLDRQLRDKSFYQFLLMREIRQVLMDCEESPPKKYSYEMWCYYLKLLGIDESNKEIHCLPAPPIKPPTKPDGSPELFNLARDIDDDGIVQPWSWLGIRSPLMSGKTEPQWIVQRLTILLQRELHLSQYETPNDIPLAVTSFREDTNTALGGATGSEGEKAK